MTALQQEDIIGHERTGLGRRQFVALLALAAHPQMLGAAFH